MYCHCSGIVTSVPRSTGIMMWQQESPSSHWAARLKGLLLFPVEGACDGFLCYRMARWRCSKSNWASARSSRCSGTFRTVSRWTADLQSWLLGSDIVIHQLCGFSKGPSSVWKALLIYKLWKIKTLSSMA